VRLSKQLGLVAAFSSNNVPEMEPGTVSVSISTQELNCWITRASTSSTTTTTLSFVWSGQNKGTERRGKRRRNAQRKERERKSAKKMRCVILDSFIAPSKTAADMDQAFLGFGFVLAW